MIARALTNGLLAFMPKARPVTAHDTRATIRRNALRALILSPRLHLSE
jgi:hypothetical protein